MTLYGVTVRWSLHATTGGVAERLRAYVSGASAGPDELPNLHQTLWTLREGGSFGVTYFFRSESDRAASVRRIRAGGSPITAILGHSADAIEEFDVLAIASGGTAV
jgi:hypothetical protein